MGSLLKLVCWLLFLALLFTGVQFLKVVHYSKKIKYTMEPFSRIRPQSTYKVLFAGDSTAVGTGASDNTMSTAALFAQDYPRASVENYSKNGIQLKDMIPILSNLEDKHYTLAILQIGANDILKMTPLKDVEEQLHTVVQLAKNIADEVIILHSGDIGKAPIFYWPFTDIYTWRSLKVRDIYLDIEDNRVSYVDILQRERAITNLQNTYAADNLHLNGDGYYVWYTFIKDEI